MHSRVLDSLPHPAYTPRAVAGVAQLVEHLLPKQGVTGSSPVTRFLWDARCPGAFFVRSVGMVGRPRAEEEMVVAEFAIEAQTRCMTGKKVRRLRSQGLVPGVVYGPAIEPVNVQLKMRPLEVLLMKAGGTNLIDISVDGETHIVLVRDVQRDILRDDIQHVDFFALRMDQHIATDVFLRFTGESPAVTTGQGILITGPGSLTIETLPIHLRNEIVISLDGLLQVGDGIYVRDLDLGDEINILNDPEEMLVRVVMPAAVAAEEDEEDGVDEVDVEADAADVERVGETRDSEE